MKWLIRNFIAKIDAFDEVDELVDIPKAQLCSFCQREKLRLMQGSPYSAYDSLQAEKLSYINQSEYWMEDDCKIIKNLTEALTDCGAATIPTTLPEPVINQNGTVVDTCISGNKYTVKTGDTCNSIAKAKSIVSGCPFVHYVTKRAHIC